MDILVALIAAHALGDFVFQTRRDVQEKHRAPVLLKHGLIHAALSYIAVGIPSAWIIPVAVFASHAVIDWVKTRTSSRGLVPFSVDQAAHLVAVIAIGWGYLALFDPAGSLWWDAFGPVYSYGAAVVAGLVITIRMGAFFVDFAVEPFLDQIEYETTEAHRRGLRNGGRTIGQLERALIFVFVLIDHFTAIGFLIAAKSIFRFGELRERSNRMEAEYIIIGTLISFLWAIVVALLTRMVLP